MEVKKIKMESYKMCMCFTRKFRMSEAPPPSDVKEAFFRYSDGRNLMSAEQLFKFLVEFQGEPKAIIEDGERIIQMILQRRHHIAKYTRHALNLDDFHHFLFSEDLNSPIKNQVPQEMSAPLSHYFIYTGHNSYLTGNQLTSDSSEKPIIKALKRGVRVIELDLWPSGNDVNVFHGRTLTPAVKLIKCLSSIKEYAFVASEYPLIITFEDHLNPRLRTKVAEMVTEIFGDELYFPGSECLKEFPSPESLKFRILISTKPPKEFLEAESFKEKAGDSSEDEKWGEEVMDINIELEPEDSDKSEENKDCQDVNDYDVKSGLLGAPKDVDDYDGTSGRSGAPKYENLIAIQAKKNKGGLKESLKVDPTRVSRLSLSEQALEKGTISRGADLVRFTQRNFLRIYPKGTRFNSSNYNPLVGWLHGAQMVAFNMQGFGRYLWLMQGMFRSNGSCGYVKKPDVLMEMHSDNRVFNPKANLPVKKTLKVKVYMGDGWRFDFKATDFDKFSPPDFYVRVGIAGVPADLRMRRTKTKEDNWIPVWDEEYCFPLTVPELALLRIEVHEYNMTEKDNFAGQTCFLVSELKSGIRTVPLYDREGEKYKSVKLLMRFEFV